MNCYSDLKIFANHRLSASNFKSFSRSLQIFFLTVGQYNFGNKVPLYVFEIFSYLSLSLPEDSRDEAGGGISITPELPEAGAYELRLPFRGPKVEKLRLGWSPWPPGPEAIISEAGTSSGLNSTTYLAGA